MDSSAQLLTQWLAYESGVTAIEYGLLAALIAVTIVGAVSATGTSLSVLYVNWSASVSAARKQGKTRVAGRRYSNRPAGY